VGHDARQPGVVAGEQPRASARRALSAALRAANPGPWLDGDAGIGAVIADGRLEAVLVTAESHDAAARDRLAPFMAIDRLGADQRAAVGAATRAGTNCGSCRPEIRLLLRAPRVKAPRVRKVA